MNSLPLSFSQPTNPSLQLTHMLYIMQQGISI